MKFKFPNISFFNNMSDDMGIDLGTANVLVTIPKIGVVYNEASAVAIDTNKNEVINAKKSFFMV